MVRWESVIIALFGTIGGLGVGLFLGWALTAVALDASSAFTAPVMQLVVVLIAGGVAGVLAAVRPARRAGRLDVLAAIATE
jgi:putative ABC transport system permease protein